MTRSLLPAVSLLSLLLLAGCVSTKKRYERAAELDAEGQVQEAVEAYLKVLEDDRDYPGAEERVLELGPQAVEELLSAARARDLEGDAVAGVALMDQARGLVERAERVGVSLPLPENFDVNRDRMRNRAVAQLEREALQAEDRGNWSSAVSAYDRALRRYAIGDGQRDALALSMAAAKMAWARDDAGNERYRTAFDRVMDARVALDTLDRDLAREAAEFADDLVAQGEQFVALLPFWRTESWMRRAPDRMRSDINDALAFDHAVPSSPFIVLLDPGPVRRELRVRRLDDAVLDRNQLARFGREMEADMVVGGEAVSFDRTEKVRRTRTRDARTRGRGGVEVTYREMEVEIGFEVAVEYRIVDAYTSRVLDEGTVSLERNGRFDRAVFDGDWTTLDLSDREARLFEISEHVAQEEDLQLQIADELAARLSEQIFREILDEIE